MPLLLRHREARAAAIEAGLLLAGARNDGLGMSFHLSAIAYAQKASYCAVPSPKIAPRA